MRRSFRYRLYPNADQTRQLAVSLETHRRIYNAALEARKEAYQKEGKTLRLKDQYPTFAAERNKQAADERAGGDGPHWYAHVSAVSMRDTIKRLDKAFDAFFRRVKEGGGKAGYPRFKGRDRYDSIPWENYNSGAALAAPGGQVVWGDMPDAADLRGHRLRLFGVGAVKVKLHRPVKGRIKTATVKREADKWYVVFSCDLGDVKVEPSALPPVGIDVGLESFLTTSDGAHEPNPRYLKDQLPELRRKQRVASRRFKRGKRRFEQSKRFREACKAVGKLHVRVKNLRKEHHYQVACRLVLAYGLIAAESLNVQGMLGSGRFSRAISDAGWSGFLGVLKGKAEKAGVSVVEVDPRGTSQECSGCGREVRKELAVRRHDCPHCGLSLHRDHNAALNILARAVGSTARTGPAGRNVGHEAKRAPERADSPPKIVASARGAVRKGGRKASKEGPLAGRVAKAGPKGG